MRHRTALFLTLFIHASHLLEAADQESAFAPERRVILTCLSWDDEIDSLNYRTLIRNPKVPVSTSSDKPDSWIMSTDNIRVSSSFCSEPQAYIGPAVIEFFITPPPVNTTSQDSLPPPAARILLPPDQGHLLLLFFSQKNSEPHAVPQYRIEILPDPLDKLPAGGYLLMNTTGKNLTGRMGKQPFELPAHSTKPLSPPATTTEKIEWLFWNETRKEKPLYSSLWQHRADARTLIIITESTEQRGALAVKAVQDITEPVSPKAGAPP